MIRLLKRSHRTAQCLLLLGVIALFSTLTPSPATAASINMTSQIATTTMTVDGMVGYGLAPSAAVVDVIDPATETVTSSIPLGVPANTARDMDYNEADGNVYVSLNDGRILKVDPDTSTVTTHGTLTGADFTDISADSYNAGTAAWVIDANTNNLYQVKTDGTFFSAGPLSQGGPVDVKTMAAQGAPSPLNYVAALIDNSQNFLQAGTVVDLYDTGIYVYIGGWGRGG